MIFVNRNLDLKCVGGVVFDLQIQPAFRHRRVNSLGNAGRIAVKVDSMCMLFCNSQRSILPIISLLSVISLELCEISLVFREIKTTTAKNPTNVL